MIIYRTLWNEKKDTFRIIYQDTQSSTDIEWTVEHEIPPIKDQEIAELVAKGLNREIIEREKSGEGV